MTPQSNFMVAAPVRAEAYDALVALLQSMNVAPGIVDPRNALVSFARYERLHVARFVVLDDQTLGDLAVYGASFPDAPIWLVFLGDCDGPAEAMLAEFAGSAAEGLRHIFAHCVEPPGNDLLGWMRQHSVKPAAQYVNWVGRTVKQIREEQELHSALRGWLARESSLREPSAESMRKRLAARVKQNGPALTGPAPTPTAWVAGQILWITWNVLLAIVLAPFLLVLSPLVLWQLRRQEKADPEITPRPSMAHVAALSRLEDHDVTNQFSAFGSVKPGWFRLALLRLVFQALEFSNRVLYTRGRLARVGTIHFARWVFLDGSRRLLFASNYDGSLDSYMDDFINKVAFGLNLVFSNGVGWPKTRFLLLGGAQREQEFKNYLRRHQLPTQVWYKAYPGLTASDLATNTRIREGLERRSMSDAEARRWLALI
jgi:hypothetical protein